MNFDFERILFYATLIAGLIYLFDVLFLAKKRTSHKKVPVIIDYARSFFPVLLIVFLLRAFVFEPFRIPSGSLQPTLLIGDFILVNKFAYGLRLPVAHTKLINNNTPQRGDIIIFRWPPNPSVDFIKRVIGVPGDHISYINKELTVNGKKIPQQYVEKGIAQDESGDEFPVLKNSEDLFGVKHDIFIDSSRASHDYKDIIVPPNMYFVMGDNRDYSADSRYFGFVPDENIVGKASFIWMSWNSKNWHIRFNRLGKVIH